jgi:hypothetical protein
LRKDVSIETVQDQKVLEMTMLLACRICQGGTKIRPETKHDWSILLSIRPWNKGGTHASIGTKYLHTYILIYR